MGMRWRTLGLRAGYWTRTRRGLGRWAGVWLPLPHLLMLPFVWRMDWWQDGMAGAWPSLICYVLSVMGMYRLGRRMLPRGWAVVATAFFGLNANLLYLATTPMTEPLFLAEFVWVVVVVWEVVEGVEQATAKAKDGGSLASLGMTPQVGWAVTQRMVLLGMLVLAATMTRYDGWVLGAAAWCVVVWSVVRAGAWRAVMPGLVTLTLLAMAGPVLWFSYNHVFGHDWLDFMRGPYSAKEIDRKTSTPGARKYWGWHNPAWSLMLYARTAQVDAAAWETGWLAAAAALWGSYQRWVSGSRKVWLLLWFPLPFYVYSISYGSVPIFIPQLYPHSFYNSRYGMEMLPVLALLGVSVSLGVAKKAGKWGPLVERFAVPVGLMLVVVNLAWMASGVPLVLKEAMVNSRGRLAFEEPLARQLKTFRPGAVILMENSDHVGALQMAGIALKQTIGPSDYYGWKRAMAGPAAAADYVVAVTGGQIDGAVKAHPEGLTELAILCTYKQPCVRVYASAR